MKKAKALGTIFGMTGAAAYGTNPLFAKYLFMGGIGVNSVLFYRYFIGSFLLFLWLKFKKKVSLKITVKEGILLFLMGLFFSLSSITLFKSYLYIDVGIASTILFVYPIMIAVMMSLFFKEKMTLSTAVAILFTTIGTSMLYKTANGTPINMKGVIYVLLSALFCAIYMVGVKKIPDLKTMNNDKLTFYVIFFGLFVYVFNLKLCTQLQILHKPFLWFCAVGIAIFPTIISIETVNLGIKLIGSTKTAILGALEPVTAICIGVSLFGEQLTLRIICGIVFVISAVILVVMGNDKSKKKLS